MGIVKKRLDKQYCIDYLIAMNYHYIQCTNKGVAYDIGNGGVVYEVEPFVVSCIKGVVSC